MGATHVSCPVHGCVIERQNKLISTPAYMLAGRINEAAEGINKTVQALMEMLDSNKGTAGNSQTYYLPLL